MCTYPFAKKALTLHLARGEGRERYFGCNLMQRKVLASSHQHLMAEAPVLVSNLDFRVPRLRQIGERAADRGPYGGRKEATREAQDRGRGYRGVAG